MDVAAGAAAAFTPAVSLLKPVRGLDQGAYDNFASFCRQDYPNFEVLFATDGAEDPAVPVIEQIARDFPAANVRLLKGAPQVTANPKASRLAALSREARHPIVVVSDSDMRVEPDYLKRVVSPLERPEVGLVTCCYRGVQPVTFTAKLEALHMGVTFLPQVVVARRFLDMHFALGATMTLRVSELQASGGWEAAGQYLAEDTHVAQQITRMGKKVVLSDYIVDSYLGPTTWREQWDREVRWARTNRGNQPREYAGLIVTLTVPLALVFLARRPGRSVRLECGGGRACGPLGDSLAGDRLHRQPRPATLASPAAGQRSLECAGLVRRGRRQKGGLARADSHGA